MLSRAREAKRKEEGKACQLSANEIVSSVQCRSAACKVKTRCEVEIIQNPTVDLACPASERDGTAAKTTIMERSVRQLVID